MAKNPNPEATSDETAPAAPDADAGPGPDALLRLDDLEISAAARGGSLAKRQAEYEDKIRTLRDASGPGAITFALNGEKPRAIKLRVTYAIKRLQIPEKTFTVKEATLKTTNERVIAVIRKA